MYDASYSYVPTYIEYYAGTLYKYILDVEVFYLAELGRKALVII